MLAIREISEWEYVTSQSVSMGAGGGWAVGIEAGSSITLKHKEKGTYTFWYASFGIGAGAGVKTPFKLPKTSGSFSFESFKSSGVLCILEAFRGDELETSDLTGYTLFLGISALAGFKGYSVYAMLLGIKNVEGLIKEAYSDILQFGQTLGGGSPLVINIQDSLGVFKNSAKAVLFMGGESAGLGLGATALGSIGYVWQGTPDKIGEVILDLKSVEEVPMPTQITAKDKSVVIAADALFDWDKDVVKREGYIKLIEAKTLIQARSKRKVLIIGHTDDTEKTPGHNQRLSERRANAVRNVLVQYGVENSRMLSKGKGATDPVTLNNTKENRAKNRRVEIIIMPD